MIIPVCGHSLQNKVNKYVGKPRSAILAMEQHPVMINETLGQRIRRLRKQRKMTQDALAEALGWSRAHLSKVETDKDDAGFRLIIAIADYFGVSLDWLAYGNDTRLGAVVANDEERLVLLRVRELSADQRGGLLRLIGAPPKDAA